MPGSNGAVPGCSGVVIEKGMRVQMTRYYSVRVQIGNCDLSHMEHVREAVEMQWDIECCVRSWDCPEGGTIRFVGKSCLYAGERPDNFTSRLCEAVWEANGAYCDVEVHAICIDGSNTGESVYAATRADYTEWKRTGELPNVPRVDDRRRQLAAA